MGRIGEITRKTKETEIWIRLDLDGRGEARLEYPLGFMAHMLTAFARHGLFDLEVRAAGDLEVDQHHLVEDTGIVLGRCFAGALGDKRGTRRVGSCLFPMDETLARSAVDLSGRAFLVFRGELSGIPLVSGAASFQTDTVEDFWEGFTQGAGISLHLDILRGRSDHHKIEALFKAAARALREACEIDPRGADLIPSTKGTLENPDTLNPRFLA
ncbi:MAG: imidazoleglycerol-phosphate dehydratase HisB [Spirochaetaceae bacterium]|jgi:imidazoleglycerol-phosphate dehydratase|nr:imidazoleglycerol-phosphate dehydratase HisB [Spirochaetaceae bacterium]